MISMTEQPISDPLVAPMPPAIASLIQSAAASFETDRNACRQFLFRACALLRARDSVQKRTRKVEVGRRRGQLASWQANRVLAHIEDNLTSEIQAKDLAGIVNLSESHFFRAFKGSLGMTPFKYIAHRRVELALNMMRTTQAPLSQIALQCGLCDQSHLCRMFRLHIGQSPNEWRRANGTPSRRRELSVVSQSL